MKKFYFCLIIFVGLSCSNESNDSERKTKTFKTSTQRIGDSLVFPNNYENPYNFAGEIYVSLFDAYFDSSSSATSITSIIAKVEDLSTHDVRFNSFKSPSYLPISEVQIGALLDDETIYSNAVISSSSLSSSSKISLTSFVTSLVLLYKQGATEFVLYDFVVAYELEILADTQLVESDKKTLLIITSIARQAAVRPKKKPKKNTDPDWDLMIGNIMAGVEGSSSGVAEAISWSLVAGICQNNMSIHSK